DSHIPSKGGARLRAARPAAPATARNSRRVHEGSSIGIFLSGHGINAPSTAVWQIPLRGIDSSVPEERSATLSPARVHRPQAGLSQGRGTENRRPAGIPALGGVLAWGAPPVYRTPSRTVRASVTRSSTDACSHAARPPGADPWRYRQPAGQLCR